MKNFLTEKNLVVVLFLLVVVVFSIAQKESKKIEYLYKTVSSTQGFPGFSIDKPLLTSKAETVSSTITVQ